MRLDDKIRIQHMIDAAEEALSFISDISEREFNKSRMLILSVIKEIEIIGEAASKISDETRIRFNNIPWQDIVGMRNKLIHGYFDVNSKLVWNTIKNDLPQLISSLKEILIINR
jgi:uncharacterized protein with HEPN domain